MTNRMQNAWMWFALFRLVVTLTMGWLALDAIRAKFILLARTISRF